MKFVNKNILLISPEPWDHIFVSKHHYSVHLSRRSNKVFFLNPPGRKKEIKSTRYPNIFEIDYAGFPPGLRFYPSFLQKKIISRVYQQLEALCAAHFDVIWSFDNSLFFDFSALPVSVLKISHIVDHSQAFQIKKAASTADVCFCTTESIKNNLERFNIKVYKINHGFNIPDPCKGISISGVRQKIKAVYAGNLSIPYIDWPLLSETIRAHHEVDFVFIGPNKNEWTGNPAMRQARENTLKNENAFVVGRVDAHELAEYYKWADVLLVAYQPNYHNDQVANPHKMMEYLGSGKVIVATHTSEYLNLYPLIVMSEKNVDWPHLFRKVISDLTFYNSKELQNQRSSFAWDNSYDQQIRRVENIISSLEKKSMQVKSDSEKS